MGADDDIPDYMRGVDQQGFGGQDNYTLRTDQAGPMGNSTFDKRSAFDGDALDDDTDERGPAVASGVMRVLTLLVGAAVVFSALLVLLGAAVAAGATVVRDAQKVALQQADALVDVVVAEKNIVTELGARGADRTKLEGMLAEVDDSSGLQRGLVALAYTHAVQEQIVALGDLRNTPIQRRQHELDIAQDRFEQSLADWRGSAGNPIGRLAVASGLADGPPKRTGP